MNIRDKGRNRPKKRQRTTADLINAMSGMPSAQPVRAQAPETGDGFGGVFGKVGDAVGTALRHVLGAFPTPPAEAAAAPPATDPQAMLQQTISQLVGPAPTAPAGALAPFDQARSSLDQAAGMAKTEIGSANNDLLRQLGVLRQAYDKSVTSDNAEITRAGHAAVSGIQSDLGPVLADLHGQGIRVPEVSATSKALQVGARDDTRRQRGFSNEMANMQRSDMQDREGSAALVNSAALGQLELNKMKALQEILTGRAQAESQMASDQASAQQAYGDRQIGVGQDLQKMLGELQKGSADQSRQAVEAEVSDYARNKGPKAPAAFYDLVSGAQSVDEAITRLNNAVTTGEMEQAGLRPEVLEDWIRRYYGAGPGTSESDQVAQLRQLLGLS